MINYSLKYHDIANFSVLYKAWHDILLFILHSRVLGGVCLIFQGILMKWIIWEYDLLQK